MVFPFPLRMDHSDLRSVSGARHPAYDELIKGHHGVGHRPQAHLASAITRVPMLQEVHAIERRLDVSPTATTRSVCRCPRTGGYTRAVAHRCRPQS